MRTLLACLLLAAGAAAPAAAQPASPAATTTVTPASGRCGVCHPAERVQFEKSRHAPESVRCVSCHGGDDRSLDAGTAHGAGFRGRPARQDIPGLCATCHADEARMRPYNLPVDQLALYQTSGHGRRLARGDRQVAVCSDCHGAHEILAPGDPVSSVYPLNIPQTCGRCHGGQGAAASRGRPDVLTLYRSSVHARALLEQGNLRAPTCVSCHGVHGANPPDLGDIDKVCGQCHTAERRYYAAGGHAVARGGRRPECASCHEAHGVQPARPERLASSCATCHPGDARRLDLGRGLWNDYRDALGEVDKAAALVAKADAIPIPTEDYRARIEEARTYLREALPAAHSVQREIVAGFTTRARAVGEEVQKELEGKFANLRQHRYVLVAFWFYVLLTLFVLRRFRDQAARNR
jgi:predicted CXXCH cytochrome family protein